MGNKITGQAIRAALDVDALNASIQTLNSKTADLESTAALLEERTETLADTKAPAIFNTADGNVATFTDGADGMAIKSLAAVFTPIQTGEGDPSLSNVRPITGRTELPLYRYAEYDAEAAPTITVNWQNTVYGSQLDIVSGQMTVDVENFLVDGSTTISTISELTNVIRFWVYTDSRFQLPDAEHVTKIMCDRLVMTSYAVDTPSYGVANAYPSTLIIKLPIGTCEATEAGIKAYLAANPIQFVLPLANPVTYQITPQEVTTLLGNNAIWTDVGPVTVEYPADTTIVVSDVKNAIDQKQTAPSSAGTAGQVLGLDSNLNPAWVDQTGGGGGMNIVTLSGTQITQVGADNTMYMCGELTELTFTAPAVGITGIRFTSGTTPTVLTVSGVTAWMFDFDPTSIEANTTYEINVLNGVGCAGWA